MLYERHMHICTSVRVCVSVYHVYVEREKERVSKLGCEFDKVITMLAVCKITSATDHLN